MGSTSLRARGPHGPAVLMGPTSLGARPPYAVVLMGPTSLGARPPRALAVLMGAMSLRPPQAWYHICFGSTGLCEPKRLGES